MAQHTTPTGPIPALRHGRSGWLAVSGLLLLSAVPVVGGAFRLGEVSADPGRTGLVASSVAMVAHIVAMSAYCLLGAFQFSPALRHRRGWHRLAGRMVIPAGFIAALSAIWLAVFFGGRDDEFGMAMVRLVFNIAMTLFLALGVVAIRRRDFDAHRSWMSRAYAIAVAGGSQALLSIVWAIPFGEVDAIGETWLVASGFVINSLIAEVCIRRPAAGRAPRRSGRGALVS
jgi:hypothetical protein